MRLGKELARGAPKLMTARSWLARRALVQGAPRRLGARCVGHASTRSVLRSWLRAQHGLRNLPSDHARPKVLSRALVSHAARVLRTIVQSAQCGPPLAPTCATTLMRRAPTGALVNSSRTPCNRAIPFASCAPWGVPVRQSRKLFVLACMRASMFATMS